MSSCLLASAGVIDGSCVDVSFIISMVIDKFCYNLQLCRHHERARDVGIQVSRSCCCTSCKRVLLVELIFDALLALALASHVKSHGLDDNEGCHATAICDRCAV